MSSRPIYAVLADELRHEISSGRWAVGDLLPREIDIAAERGISRSTVRAALNCLVEEGLISRRKGSGTRVVARRPARAFDASTSTIEDLVHFGLATNRTVLGREPVTADDALSALLGCAPGSRWIKITTLRWATSEPDRPLCLTQTFLQEAYSDAISELETYKGLIADLIFERTGVAVDSVEQVIHPIIVEGSKASLLKAPEGISALEITRRYLSRGMAVQISISIHPSDRFEYRITLKRQHQLTAVA